MACPDWGHMQLHHLTRGRGTVRYCLRLVIAVGVINIVLVLPLFFFVRYIWIWSNTAVSISDPAAVTSQESPWRPPRTMMTRVLKELNLSEEEAQQHLAVTLDSKLWLNNASLCADASGQPDPLDVLYVVNSAPDRFHRRLLMRSTIARELNFRPFKIRTVFVVGRVLDGSLQQALQMEHQLYGDTVQGDFMDSDSNLSHKGVLGFRWVWQYCAQARYVVKMDDNVFFDTYKMLLLHRAVFQGRSRALFCHVLPQGTMRIFRKHDHPWAVEESQFKGLKTFPYDYCSGLVVVLTSDLIPALYRAASFTPVFWIEDVYLFGMLPAMLGDVTLLHLGYLDRFIDLNTTSAVSCMKRDTYHCSVLATVCRTTDDWETMWNLTYNLYHNTNWRVPFLQLPSYN